jgi:hypothetical protein
MAESRCYEVRCAEKFNATDANFEIRIGIASKVSVV